jgi:hypothetical protein
LDTEPAQADSGDTTKDLGETKKVRWIELPRKERKRKFKEMKEAEEREA